MAHVTTTILFSPRLDSPSPYLDTPPPFLCPTLLGAELAISGVLWVFYRHIPHASMNHHISTSNCYTGSENALDWAINGVMVDYLMNVSYYLFFKDLKSKNFLKNHFLPAV